MISVLLALLRLSIASCVSFGKLSLEKFVHFIWVIKFVDIDFFHSIPLLFFYAHRICNDDPTFSFHISNQYPVFTNKTLSSVKLGELPKAKLPGKYVRCTLNLCHRWYIIICTVKI